MGLSVYTSLVVGVEAKYKEVKVIKTRYDEKTGKPCQIEIEDGQWLLAGTDIAVNVLDYGEEEDEDEGVTGIPVYEECEDTDSISFIKGGLVGLVLSQISEMTATEIGEVPFHAIAEAVKSVAQQLLDRYGYFGKVKVFLVKELSS
jgi:hypothetical protein